jgi:hypothetical protein
MSVVGIDLLTYCVRLSALYGPIFGMCMIWGRSNLKIKKAPATSEEVTGAKSPKGGTVARLAPSHFLVVHT